MLASDMHIHVKLTDLVLLEGSQIVYPGRSKAGADSY